MSYPEAARGWKGGLQAAPSAVVELRPRSGASVPDLTRWAIAKMQAGCPELVAPKCVELAEEHNLRWARRFDLIPNPAAEEKLARTRCALLSALTYPRTGWGLIQFGANYMTWLFLFDDLYGEGGESGDGAELERATVTLPRLLRTGRLPSDADPFHRSLLHLRDRAIAWCGVEWLERMAVDLQMYLDGCLLELPYRKANPDHLAAAAVQDLAAGGLRDGGGAVLRRALPLPRAAAEAGAGALSGREAVRAGAARLGVR
jgi:hypothetical protein